MGMVRGIPFIGQDDYYPPWAKYSGRWVFQRTLVSVGGVMAGFAELSAESVPAAKQVIVWAPQRRGFLDRFSPLKIHRERENAIGELSELHFLCYGSECKLKLESPMAVRKFVREYGIHPEEWTLNCPQCGGIVGPDLASMTADAILLQWEKIYRPPLDNPAASAAFKSAPIVVDLTAWIQKNEPSHLELAYFGQQMWPRIAEMFDALADHP